MASWNIFCGLSDSVYSGICPYYQPQNWLYRHKLRLLFSTIWNTFNLHFKCLHFYTLPDNSSICWLSRSMVSTSTPQRQEPPSLHPWFLTHSPNGSNLECLMSDEPNTGPGLGDLEKELVCSVCPWSWAASWMWGWAVEAEELLEEACPLPGGTCIACCIWREWEEARETTDRICQFRNTLLTVPVCA